VSQTIGQRAVKTLGAVFFLLGAGALVAVFFLAYGVFRHPLPPPSGEPASSALAWSGVGAAVRLVACFVMAYVGWLLCGRGVQLYGAGRRG